MFSLQIESLGQDFYSYQRIMEQTYGTVQATNRETEGFRSILNDPRTVRILESSDNFKKKS